MYKSAFIIYKKLQWRLHKTTKKQLRDDKIFIEELISNIVDAYQGFAKSVINLNVAESHTLRASILEQLGRAEEVKK